MAVLLAQNVPLVGVPLQATGGEGPAPAEQLVDEAQRLAAHFAHRFGRRRRHPAVQRWRRQHVVDPNADFVDRLDVLAESRESPNRIDANLPSRHKPRFARFHFELSRDSCSRFLNPENWAAMGKAGWKELDDTLE